MHIVYHDIKNFAIKYRTYFLFIGRNWMKTVLWVLWLIISSRWNDPWENRHQKYHWCYNDQGIRHCQFSFSLFSHKCLPLLCRLITVSFHIFCTHCTTQLSFIKSRKIGLMVCLLWWLFFQSHPVSLHLPLFYHTLNHNGNFSFHPLFLSFDFYKNIWYC